MGIVVMTGSTSGFGAIAARRLADRDGVRLVRGTRSDHVSGDDLPLDLTSLGSVRQFANALVERVDGAGVDALVLNAGVIRPDAAGRTVDGHETTFAVNHLAHHLLLRLLLPSMTEDARVVLTSSGTHDPATGAGLAPPRHADARLLADPAIDPGLDPRPRRAGQHAYTASKLCAVLTARSVARDHEARRRRVTAIAWDPGQVFGTGLVQDLAIPLRVAWSVLGTPLGAPLRRLRPTLNTPPAAGTALADLVVGSAAPPRSGAYAVLRRGRLGWVEPSLLARDDDLGNALWTESDHLVGLREH